MRPRSLFQAVLMGLVLLIGWWFLRSMIATITMQLARTFWWMFP